MAKSKYYIDFSDSIKTLSKEVNNANDYCSKIPKKDDMTKEFNNLEFLQKIDIGDDYRFLEEYNGGMDDASYIRVKYKNDDVQFNVKKKNKVNSLSEFNSFTSNLEAEIDEVENVSSNLNTLIADLLDKLDQAGADLKGIKIDGKSIVDLTESINTLKNINI